MGFTPKKRTYRLKFAEDDDLYGFEIRMHPPSIDELMQIIELQGRTDLAAEEARLPFELFARHLIDWNFELDGEPVPATLEGLRRLDSDDFGRINAAWQNAVQGVPAPLQKPSDAGAPSPVPPIPMESLSQSQAS